MEETDRLALEKFSCRNPAQRWTKAAERAIRTAPAGIADGFEAQIVVAEDGDGGIVGAVVFGPDDDATRFVIHSLGVVKDRRRQGIGERLKVAALAEIVAVVGHEQDVFSEVHKNNLAMRALNEKLGAQSERDPDHRDRYLTAIKPSPAP